MPHRSPGPRLSEPAWRTLGFGAGRLRGLFTNPGSWRILDGLIAVMMVALGISLTVT